MTSLLVTSFTSLNSFVLSAGSILQVSYSVLNASDTHMLVSVCLPGLVKILKRVSGEQL